MAEQSTKITCHACNKFIGFIQSDGSGPILDCGEKKCPLAKPLARYQPREIPTYMGVGNGHNVSHDADETGIYDRCRKHLED